MFDSLTGLAPGVEAPADYAGIAPDPGVRRHTFELRATRFLRSFVLSEALDLARSVQGFWHPTGFMAFHTPLRFGTMPVRVHCWPRGARPVEDRHPELHNHMWGLASKVLAGTYSETVYALERAPDGEYAHYAVDYHGRDDATVVDDGHRYRVRTVTTRKYTPGEVHKLGVGVFHETTIPETECVVTVMVTGPREIDSCSLVGRPGFPPGRRARRPVTPDEFERAVGDLLR